MTPCKRILRIDKTSSTTYPPNNAVAVKNEYINFVQELCLRITQLQHVSHVKGGFRCESTGRWSSGPPYNCRRKMASAAECNYIACGCKQWRSEKKFPGRVCELHGIHKLGFYKKYRYTRDFLLLFVEGLLSSSSVSRNFFFLSFVVHFNFVLRSRFGYVSSLMKRGIAFGGVQELRDPPLKSFFIHQKAKIGCSVQVLIFYFLLPLFLKVHLRLLSFSPPLI